MQRSSFPSAAFRFAPFVYSRINWIILGTKGLAFFSRYVYRGELSGNFRDIENGSVSLSFARQSKLPGV